MDLRNGILLGLACGIWGTVSWATDTPYQPYINQLLQEMPESRPDFQSGNSPYLDKIQSKLKENPEPPAGAYIEGLRATDPLRDEKKDENYLEKQKSRLEPKKSAGAIQAYHEGKSELEFKRPGSIHNAMGMRYSLSIDRTIESTGSQAGAFNNIYGGIYAPQFALFYEYQPFHSEWFGNIGILASVGIDYFYGVARYALELRKPGTNNGHFPINSLTKLQFFSVPITAALNYRFNLFRILRPYAMIGPTLIGYLESRNDGGPVRKGYSQGFTTSIGVSVLMDWFNKNSSWDLYSEYSVKHYYLTLDYTRLATLGGDVRFSYQGISAGLTFEY